MGAQRHLSQCPGGVVLTHERLDDLVPIEPAAMIDRQVIEWDKDDIDALKFMKVDVLALGMLTFMKKAFDFLAEHRASTSIWRRSRQRIAHLRDDPQSGHARHFPEREPSADVDAAAHQSPNLLRPRDRGGDRTAPIQADMVHPYLRRREGLEPVVYPKPELEQVLRRTLGLPLFQEQAMRVAIVCAGFTPGEADQLRKSMATFKFTGGVSAFRDKLVAGMVANGYEQGSQRRPSNSSKALAAMDSLSPTRLLLR
jgi:error-prone DNA polymerase